LISALNIFWLVQDLPRYAVSLPWPFFQQHETQHHISGSGHILFNTVKGLSEQDQG